MIPVTLCHPSSAPAKHALPPLCTVNVAWHWPAVDAQIRVDRCWHCFQRLTVVWALVGAWVGLPGMTGMERACSREGRRRADGRAVRVVGAYAHRVQS
jgi:hypothetical protein